MPRTRSSLPIDMKVNREKQLNGIFSDQRWGRGRAPKKSFLIDLFLNEEQAKPLKRGDSCLKNSTLPQQHLRYGQVNRTLG